LWWHILVDFSVMPLRLSSLLGLVLFLCGIVLSVAVVFEKLMARDILARWAFLTIITMLLSGAQLLILGVMGEYIGHLFRSTNATPQFVIREYHGLRVEYGNDKRD
jgi:undecaprenyl-phosphate 4-deoxy-4-formamido-L-arabinose transferase